MFKSQKEGTIHKEWLKDTNGVIKKFTVTTVYLPVFRINFDLISEIKI